MALSPLPLLRLTMDILDGKNGPARPRIGIQSRGVPRIWDASCPRFELILSSGLLRLT